jgi:hypothetical protein
MIRSPSTRLSQCSNALVVTALLVGGCSLRDPVLERRSPDGGARDGGGGAAGGGGGTSGAGATSGQGGTGGASGGGAKAGTAGVSAGGAAGASGESGGSSGSGGSVRDAATDPDSGSGNGGSGGVDAGPGCVPETDPAFCTRLHKTCGSVSAPDNCGARRSASCGTCTTPETCGAGNTCVPPNCVPESNPAFCSRLGKECNVFSGYDNCGVGRSTNCGTCTQPEVCQADSTCVCPAETNAQFCARLGKNCGSVTAADNCGKSRTTSCGGCTAPKTCGATNVCACVAETTTAFCTRLGKNCGSVTAADICGTSRTINCGTCLNSQSCGNKNVCVDPLACTGRNDPITITFFDFTGSTAPTPAGGTLVDGYYASTKISAYGSVDSAIGGSLEIRSGFIRRVHTTYNKQGSALTGWTESGTYVTSGTNIVDTVTNCNFGGTGTQNLAYTAGANQIRLFDTIQGSTVVTQYDLQP